MVASVRRGQQLPLCWTQPAPMDALLDRAEPIGQAGGTSGKCIRERVQNAAQKL